MKGMCWPCVLMEDALRKVSSVPSGTKVEWGRGGKETEESDNGSKGEQNWLGGDRDGVRGSCPFLTCILVLYFGPVYSPVFWTVFC